MNCKTILKVLVSGTLILFLIWKINIDELLESIKNVDLFILIFALLLSIPGILVSTIKWNLLLRSQGISEPGFLRLWVLYHIGMFFSNFMPTEVGGDLYRSYIVGKVNNRQSDSLAAVTLERITGFVAVIILALYGIFLNWRLAQKLHLTYVVFGVSAIVTVGLVLLFNRKFTKWTKGMLDNSSCQKIIKKVKSFYEAIYAFKNRPRIIVQSLIISIIFQMLVIVYVFVLALSLNIESSIFQMMLVVPVITLIGVIPVSINSIGLREGAFVYLFTAMDVSMPQSFALSLLFRIGSLIPGLLGGFMYMVDEVHIRK